MHTQRAGDPGHPNEPLPVSLSDKYLRTLVPVGGSRRERLTFETLHPSREQSCRETACTWSSQSLSREAGSRLDFGTL